MHAVKQSTLSIISIILSALPTITHCVQLQSVSLDYLKQKLLLTPEEIAYSYKSHKDTNDIKYIQYEVKIKLTKCYGQ